MVNDSNNNGGNGNNNNGGGDDKDKTSYLIGSLDTGYYWIEERYYNYHKTTMETAVLAKQAEVQYESNAGQKPFVKIFKITASGTRIELNSTDNRNLIFSSSMFNVISFATGTKAELENHYKGEIKGEIVN